MFPQQSQDAPKSLLADLRNYHKVLVHNPLSKAFTWQIARSVVQNDPRYVDQTISQMNMRNDAHPTMAHVYSYVTIEAGETKYLPGDVAQTYVKHLVDELMYKAGHKQTVGDPHLRRQFEEEVVLNSQDLRSDLSTTSMEDQLAKQIADMNREPSQSTENIIGKEDEQPFPELGGNDAPAIAGVQKPASKTDSSGQKRSKQPAT